MTQAYEKYRHDKQRAEEMLLIQPQSHMNRTIVEERETYPRSSKDLSPHNLDGATTTRNKYQTLGVKSELESDEDGLTLTVSQSLSDNVTPRAY